MKRPQTDTYERLSFAMFLGFITATILNCVSMGYEKGFQDGQKESKGE